MALYDKDDDARRDGLSDIITVFYRKSKEEEDYSKLSMSERWSRMKEGVERHTYRIYVDKYFAGERSMSKLIQESLASMLEQEVGALFTAGNEMVAKSKKKIIYALGGMIGAGLLTMYQLSGISDKGELSTTDLVVIGASSLVSLGCMVYSWKKAKGIFKMGNAINEQNVKMQLDADIVRNMDNNEFSKALDWANEKLLLPFEVK